MTVGAHGQVGHHSAQRGTLACRGLILKLMCPHDSAVHAHALGRPMPEKLECMSTSPVTPQTWVDERCLQHLMACKALGVSATHFAELHCCGGTLNCALVVSRCRTLLLVSSPGWGCPYITSGRWSPVSSTLAFAFLGRLCLLARSVVFPDLRFAPSTRSVLAPLKARPSIPTSPPLHDI